MDDDDEHAKHHHRPSPRRHDNSSRRSLSVDSNHRRHRPRPERPESGPARRPNVRPIRGEVDIRVVDFAHTTTGRDFIPFAPGEDHVGPLDKGYESRIDETTGLAMARFPARRPKHPDLGFVFGLKSVCEALREIWAHDRGERGMSELTDGKVFERAFPEGFDTALLST
jgi:inositol-hexakisphosphate kinase